MLLSGSHVGPLFFGGVSERFCRNARAARSNSGYSTECRICGGVMENDNTSSPSPASDVLPMLEYAYTHEQTQATTGYFSCIPPENLNFELALERLEAAPMDDFLHLHLLRLLSGMAPADLSALAADCYDAGRTAFTRPVLAALLAECALLGAESPEQGQGFCASFPPDAPERLAAYSPAVYLRAATLPDHKTAAAWSALFRANICDHHSLPRLDEAGIAPLFSADVLDAAARRMAAHADALSRQYEKLGAEAWEPWQRPPAQETYLRAVDALLENGVVDGPEMRHEASLSPIALLRGWQVDIAVTSGAVRHTLRGKATAYGRGLSLAAARASYAMEIVERASTYVSVGPGDGTAHAGTILGRKTELPLTLARFSELAEQGRAALDPNLLPLEAPYTDAPLHWLPAVDAAGATVLVPAQAVFLFCNLDEQALFIAGGSTGLASGNIMDEAVVAALTEIAERDAEATTPYSRTRCFTLRSRDQLIQSLLDDYAACGIRVQFQDLTTELGLPVYQCFVTGRDGRVARATGANLCGARAALAALTETPWPYSTSQNKPPCPSGSGLAGLPVRVLEDLPDYSLPSPRANRQLLESVLSAHGRSPLYVDLTRKDFDIPVVRAIVPGLALTAEWDRFSRPDARLFARYAACCL